MGLESNTIFHCSISPTFYKRILWAKIPTAQKNIDDLTVFLLSWYLRELVNMLVKLTPEELSIYKGHVANPIKLKLLSLLVCSIYEIKSLF